MDFLIKFILTEAFSRSGFSLFSATLSNLNAFRVGFRNTPLYYFYFLMDVTER